MKTVWIRSTLIVLSLAASAIAQRQPATKPAAESRKTETFTRVYDIRDLLLDFETRGRTSRLVPPTRIGESKVGVAEAAVAQPQPLFGQSSPKLPASESLADQVLKLVEDTTDRDSWRDNGGTVGAIRIMFGQMIITQTPENHELIQSLLSQLRESQARMVSVVARWVLLGPDQLQQVAQPLKGNGILQTVNVAVLEKSTPPPVKFRAQVTCYNGQTVDLSSGRAKTIVTNVTPAVANVAAYQPESSIVQDGVNLRLTPTLSFDNSTVTVDVESVLSAWGSVQPSGFAPSTQPANMDVPATIDRVDVDVQQFHTTVAVPLGKPILVGGLSLPSGAAKDDQGKQMYLVIEVVGAK
jgi:hypothetical protein